MKDFIHRPYTVAGWINLHTKFDSSSKLFVTTTNKSISTPSQILSHKLTRTCLIDAARVMFAKLYQAIRLCKKRTKRHGRKRAALDLSVCAYQPLEKSLIHTDPLLICPADAAATAKTSVPPWQHDHSCFRQEWVGTLELSTLQSGIK